MKKLGELLVEREWVTREQLTQALRHQQVFGGRLGTCLLELTLVSEDRLTKALADQLGVPPVTQEDLRVIGDGLIELIPAKLASKARAIPFERFGNALSVALVDPRDLVAQDELSFVTSRRLKVHVAPEVRILEALERHYSFPAEPRYARIWDRLNRAKYLWQEETAASSGARRRPDAPPTPAPMTTVHAPDWQPAPPPPLESGVRRIAAAAAAVPVAPTAPTLRQPVLVPPDPPAPAPAPAPPAPAPRRRWFFGRQAAPGPEPEAVVPPPAVGPPADLAAAATAPRLPAPAAPIVPPPLVSPSLPALRPAPPAEPRRAASVAPAPAPPAVVMPVVSPPHPKVAPLAPAQLPEVAAAPTPSPLAGAAAVPAAANKPGTETLPPASPPSEAVAADADTTPLAPILVAKPVASLADFEARIAEVEERDDVAHAALSFLSRRFHRNLLFMVRGATVAAWMGGGEGVDQRLFGELEVSFEQPSLFLNLREGSKFYRGPLPRLDAHQRLVRVWGGRYPKECLLLPVRINDRLVAVVYCDRGNEDLHEVDFAEMQQAAALMGHGFERFLLKRKERS